MSIQTLTRKPTRRAHRRRAEGIDLDQPLSEATKKELRDAWIESGLVLLRGALHSADAHMRLSEVFGEMEPSATSFLNSVENPFLMELRQTPGNPKVSALRARRGDPGGLHRVALGPVLHADDRARGRPADGRARFRVRADRLHRRDRRLRAAERGDEGPDRGPRGGLRVQPRDGGEPRLPPRRGVAQQVVGAPKLPAGGAPPGDHPARDRPQGAEAVTDALQDGTRAWTRPRRTRSSPSWRTCSPRKPMRTTTAGTPTTSSSGTTGASSTASPASPRASSRLGIRTTISGDYNVGRYLDPTLDKNNPPERFDD